MTDKIPSTKNPKSKQPFIVLSLNLCIVLWECINKWEVLLYIKLNGHMTFTSNIFIHDDITKLITNCHRCGSKKDLNNVSIILTKAIIVLIRID